LKPLARWRGWSNPPCLPDAWRVRVTAATCSRLRGRARTVGNGNRRTLDTFADGYRSLRTWGLAFGAAARPSRWVPAASTVAPWPGSCLRCSLLSLPGSPRARLRFASWEPSTGLVATRAVALAVHRPPVTEASSPEGKPRVPAAMPRFCVARPLIPPAGRQGVRPST
jgi:hypothetical protein